MKGEPGFAATRQAAVTGGQALRAQSGNWAGAIAAYHLGDNERRLAYHQHVALARRGAAWAVVPLPARLYPRSLCVRAAAGADRPPAAGWRRAAASDL